MQSTPRAARSPKAWRLRLTSCCGASSSDSKRQGAMTDFLSVGVALGRARRALTALDVSLQAPGVGDGTRTRGRRDHNPHIRGAAQAYPALSGDLTCAQLP